AGITAKDPAERYPELNLGRQEVRRDRQKLKEGGAEEPSHDGSPCVKFNEATGDGKFENVRSEGPLTDWSHVFHKFGLSHHEFVIIDDTVTMKAWEQSKRLENGDRDTVTLYSYGARFRRKVEDHGVSLSD